MRVEQRSVSTGAVVGALLVIGVVAFLFPIFARAIHDPCAPRCESNLKQIGNAVKMYLADWDNTYPTNRLLLPNGKPGRITSHAELSPLEPLTASGEQPRFVHSISWVEALYSYVEAVTKKEDAYSVWWCDKLGRPYLEGLDQARVSYVFNRNLIERKTGVVSDISRTLMAREMDRLVEAELRPTNDSMWTGKRPPVSPFLTDRDHRLGRTDNRIHTDGSNVLFADGHVKLFHPDSMPDRAAWDPQTKRWYNFVYQRPAGYLQRQKNMSIAITP